MPSVVNSLDDRSFTIFKASLADEALGEPGGWCEAGTAPRCLECSVMSGCLGIDLACSY